MCLLRTGGEELWAVGGAYFEMTGHDGKLMPHSWSDDVSFMAGEEEDASLLPRSQRQLVSKFRSSIPIGALKPQKSFEESSDSLSTRKSSDENSVPTIDGVVASYGAVPNASRRRKNKKVKHNILDAMIQSERYELSSRKRYMVPHYDEEIPEALEREELTEAPARVVEYSPDHVSVDREVPDFSTYLVDREDSDSILWIYVEGEPNAALKILDTHFKIHPLAQEDVVTTPQRPKLDQCVMNFKKKHLLNASGASCLDR